VTGATGEGVHANQAADFLETVEEKLQNWKKGMYDIQIPLNLIWGAGIA
jgi:hypothetical protein